MSDPPVEPSEVVYLDVDDALEIFGAIIGGTATQAADQLRDRAALAGSASPGRRGTVSCARPGATRSLPFVAWAREGGRGWRRGLSLREVSGRFAATTLVRPAYVG